METFADYILGEEDLAAKFEIAYYLAKKRRIYFNKSVIFKTEILRLFLNFSKIEVNRNEILTASILCNCKKVSMQKDIEKIHSYAKEGAQYLESIGFNEKFCKMCEEINRYSGRNPREKEGDILELVDQFGGMLLDRPERAGFEADEAIILLEHRNLKDEYNRYLNTFEEFVKFMQNIEISEGTKIKAFHKLTKLHNDSKDIPNFIKKVVYEFEPKVDKVIEEEKRMLERKMFEEEESKRPLFSQETTKKVLRHIIEENMEKKSEIEE